MSIHLFVSPHLDDVALSASGIVARRIAAGDQVVVATVCTADSPPAAPLSNLAKEVHHRWGNAESPYAVRRSEDIACCTLLHVDCRHLDLPDAVYRCGLMGHGEYQSFAELFGPIPEWDQPFTEKVRAALATLVAEVSPDVVYGPLCVGANVDHQHVQRAMLALDATAIIRFYEDQPYATGRYPTDHPDPIGEAVNELPMAVIEERHPIELAGKHKALLCYSSQLDELFGTDRRVLAAMNDYARSLGKANGSDAVERIWGPFP